MNEVYRDIEQHIPHLRRYARAIAHNPVAADDLVQESLLRALAKAHLYRPGTNLRAWLFTILHNQHVSDMRRNARVGIPVDPDDAAPALASRPSQETGLIVGALERALRQLPDKQRILIELVALGDLSYEEVARAYDLPLGTVKSRISRGRSQLRDALEGRDKHGAASPLLQQEDTAGRTKGPGKRSRFATLRSRALRAALLNLRSTESAGKRGDFAGRAYHDAA